MLNVITFILLASCARATLVKFTDCGSKGATINSVDASPCPVQPCVLHAGNNYTITVNYTASEDTNTGKTVLHGIIGGIPLPFPVPDSNACHDMTCPVKSGVTQVYQTTLFCSPQYPKIKLLAKWEVTDDNNADLFCFVSSP